MSQPGPPDRDPRRDSDSTFGIVRHGIVSHIIVSGDLEAGLDDVNSQRTHRLAYLKP